MNSPAFDLSVSVRELQARRGGRVVASNVSFNLGPGDALTLRGENGSGKTSILRAIAGFSATEDAIAFHRGGTAQDAAETRARSIHWLGGADGIADRLTVTENIKSWQSILGAPPGNINDLLDEVALSALRARPAGKLSTGQRRRLGFARIMMAPRALWLLDEPFNGLDEDGRALMLRSIAHHRESGGIVLMASHDDGLPDAPTLRLRATGALV